MYTKYINSSKLLYIANSQKDSGYVYYSGGAKIEAESDLKEIKVLDSCITLPDDCCWMFNGFKNLTSIDLSNFDTSNVTDMWWMFLDCKNLEEIVGLDKWDTGNVELFTYMFEGCVKLPNFDSDVLDLSAAHSCTDDLYPAGYFGSTYSVFYNGNKLNNTDKVVNNLNDISKIIFRQSLYWKKKVD